MKSYEYRLIVSFEETNLVGNVYYANHVRWQGRCREMFLHDHAPDVLDMLHHGLALATTRVSCEYLSELCAFDDVLIRMSLANMTQNRVAMRFEYFRVKNGREELVARGEQEIASMQRDPVTPGRMVPTPLPDSLREALKKYAD